MPQEWPESWRNWPLASSEFTSVWPEQWRCQQAWTKPHPAVISRSNLSLNMTYIYIYIYVCMYVCIYIYICYNSSSPEEAPKLTPRVNTTPVAGAALAHRDQNVHCTVAGTRICDVLAGGHLGRWRCTGLRREDHSQSKLISPEHTFTLANSCDRFCEDVACAEPNRHTALQRRA